MNIRGRKILVTGAGGFIGSHVTEYLLGNGADVTAFLRYTSTGAIGHLASLNSDTRRMLSLVYGDIRNRDDAVRAVSGNDIIIHLAAQIAIPYSYISPADFLNVNAVGTLNVLEAGREARVKRIVHLSTSEVYGSAQYVPIDEQHPLVAQSPYAASKIAADKIAESFHRSFGTPVVIARPFNTYGPRQSARAVIPTIILQALRGKTIRLGNIDTRRDLNYVGDTATALVRMALSSKNVGLQFNIASGKDYSIAELVEFVADILGRNLTIKSDRRRIRPKGSEVTRLQGDGSRAVRSFRLGRRTDIKTGLKKTIAYYEANIATFSVEDYQV
jgi:NAD dependent epimerase/dehydratase